MSALTRDQRDKIAAAHQASMGGGNWRCLCLGCQIKPDMDAAEARIAELEDWIAGAPHHAGCSGEFPPHPCKCGKPARKELAELKAKIQSSIVSLLVEKVLIRRANRIAALEKVIAETATWIEETTSDDDEGAGVVLGDLRIALRKEPTNAD